MMPSEQLFTPQALAALFPPERANDFFDALFGDAEEGAYDIRLSWDGFDPASGELRFLLNLHERPGRCLACNLTYGLPEVFSRHPVINIKGLVGEVEAMLAGEWLCKEWKLGRTIQHGRSLHSIPLVLHLHKG